MTKQQLLEKLPAGPMRQAHKNQSIEFIRQSIADWIEADDITRIDIMAFFESGGPRKVERVLRELGVR